jgi:Acetoacetate decarboxylase (ADC)
MSSGQPTAATTPPTQFVIHDRTIALPVCVRDAVQMTAMFVVPIAPTRELVGDSRLRVAELFPGRTVCVIAAVEYLDNDLGVYNEVAISFFVERSGQASWPVVGPLVGFLRGGIGAYIHRLPVTTAFSRDAGRDIWGFPKTVEDITFHTTNDRRTCRLAAGGQHVLDLTMAVGGNAPMKRMAQDAYALRDGVLYHTPSTMWGEGASFRLGGAELTLGPHPWAQELRGLGLPKRALMTTTLAHMHAEFGAPARL